MAARMIIALVALTVIPLLQPGSAQAAPYWPWCSQYGGRSSAHACAFISWEQCMETVRGIGGYCYVNPYPRPVPEARSAKPRLHVRYDGPPSLDAK